MIRKLQKTIRLSLILLLSAFLVGTAGLFCHVIIGSISNSFVQTSSQHIRQQSQNVRLYQQLIEESSQIISTNSFIVERLAGGDPRNEISAKLDGLMGMTMGIKGISIYSLDGRIYHTNNIYSYTDQDNLLDDIQKNAPANRPVSFWMVRHKGLDTLKVGNVGYFSYISEIHGPSGRWLGYLLVDTDLSSLFRYYIGETGGYFQNTSVFLLTSDGQLFPAPANPPQDGVDPMQIAGEASGKLMPVDGGRGILAVTALPESGDRVVEYIPMNIRRFMYLVILLFVTVCAGCIFLCWKGVGLVSDSIVLPLSELYRKIRHTTRN